MSVNGNGTSAHVEEPAGVDGHSVLLVPMSGHEAVSMFAAALTLESLLPFVQAIGVTGFEGYAQVLRNVYNRWLAETGRPAQGSEASV